MASEDVAAAAWLRRKEERKEVLDCLAQGHARPRIMPWHRLLQRFLELGDLQGCAVHRDFQPRTRRIR